MGGLAGGDPRGSMGGAHGRVEGRTLTGLGFDTDAPTGVLDDTLADRQAHACTREVAAEALNAPKISLLWLFEEKAGGNAIEVKRALCCE